MKQGRAVTAQGTLDAPGVQAGDPAAHSPEPDADPQHGWLGRLAREHGLFAVVLVASAIVRVIAMLGYRGVMRTPDSNRYLRNAIHLSPGTVRPSGYSFLLWLLEPAHSLTLIVGLQYLMGLGIGVTGYLLLRRAGLPGWAATLAMIPPLLSANAVQLEHFLLSDTLFALAVMVAMALVMWWPTPPLWASAVAGVLLAVAALTRSEGTPLLVVFVIYLLVRFTRWRTVAAVLAICAAFALPMAAYAAWYDDVHGSFGVTSSNGAFLYGAAATFANCHVINPPAAERSLCLTEPVSDREWSDYYVFAGPISKLPGGPFGKQASSLGEAFALRAIRAQPGAYLRVVADSFWQNFLPPANPDSPSAIQRNLALHDDEYAFPASPPKAATGGVARLYATYDPAGSGLRIVQPFAGWIRAYQRYVVVPGPLVGALVFVGLGGVLVAWRRLGGSALLPWLVGTGMLLVPAAIAEAYPRYVVGDVPPLCVAAALGIAQMAGAFRRPDRQAGAHRRAEPESVSAAS